MWFPPFDNKGPPMDNDHSSGDRVNHVKGAIIFSNIVTTVSPTYAQEVRTYEGGKGLHSTLNANSKKFIGILNGIDTDSWNPAPRTLSLRLSSTLRIYKGKKKTNTHLESSLDFLQQSQTAFGLGSKRRVARRSDETGA
ncbi:PREDICTED: probable starch synthase 4, chloroplastic/amyloplastic [Brassica oleracea var. oleracea]|uniref:probable starch synthase 4, chloroplastic/amyloplastic n=1 Tax=Brassica oleracea var. oleracea TaxID=109376 RepID=UPI0006A75601|nr:PREDICTED: probable starch synthase 4, chloroplastic/amyloplastic [Brassica oleracea var. oleracea]